MANIERRTPERGSAAVYIIQHSVGHDKINLVFTRHAIADIEDGQTEAALDGEIVDNSEK